MIYTAFPGTGKTYAAEIIMGQLILNHLIINGKI